MRILAASLALLLPILAGTSPSLSQEWFAALAPNSELSAPVVWGKNVEEVKRKAVAACEKISDSCAGPAWTDDPTDVFATMCCDAPKHGCAVGMGASVEDARDSVNGVFAESGYSKCTVGKFYSAKTGKEEVAVETDDEGTSDTGNSDPAEAPDANDGPATPEGR